MPDDPFYDGHRMTRQGMERWLVENQGSIIHTEPNGTKRLITHPSQLPDAAELAKGNSAAEARVRQDLQTQVAAIQRQLATLTPEAETEADGGKKTKTATPPDPGTPPADAGADKDKK